MGIEGIAAALGSATEYLLANRDDARYTDGAATARLDSGLRVEVEGASGEGLVTDMPTSVGGGGSAPSPGWFLRAAVASCDATLIAMRAAQVGVELTRLEVVVDSESDDYGILGLDDSVPAGPLSMRVRVRVESPGATEGILREIVAWGTEHCPVHDAVRRAVPTTVELELG